MQDHLQVSGTVSMPSVAAACASHRTEVLRRPWTEPGGRILANWSPSCLNCWCRWAIAWGHSLASGYRRDDWTDTPPATLIDGRTVDLLGFDGAEAPGVILIGNDGHHVTLAVVAPEAGERDARQVLDAVPAGEAGVAGSAREATAAKFTTDVAHRLAAHEGLDDDERTAQIRRLVLLRLPLSSRRPESKVLFRFSSSTSSTSRCCGRAR